MTYFGFLAIFVLLPIILLTVILRWQNKPQPPTFGAFNCWLVLLVHIVIAVVYTSPWDNYLVATGVWWYDPALVTGITIGWVPIEEYTFFVVQPILTGIWLILLMRNRVGISGRAMDFRPNLNRTATIALAVLWLASTILLLSGLDATTYLTLELSWALIPIGVQIAFGADILWHHRKLVAAALIPSTLYLAATDAVAIGSGTWTIDPVQSTGVLLGGILPIEEFIFFLITNILIVFGMTLALSSDSRDRINRLLELRSRTAL